MASKVDSVMSTSIALETLKASNSINSLTKAVRSSTSAWKAQEAQLKSNGDYLKASEARYEGLGKSIEAEKKRIENICFPDCSFPDCNPESSIFKSVIPMESM